MLGHNYRVTVFDGKIATIRYLKKQNLNLNSILKNKQRVQTFHRVALKPGGVVHNLDIAQTLSSKNQQLFLNILDYFDAKISRWGMFQTFQELSSKSIKLKVLTCFNALDNFSLGRLASIIAPAWLDCKTSY